MGRLWKFEETINTDVLAPGPYMNSPLSELARHCLEAVRPEFASSVRAGDVLLASDNMGVGSSREQAAEVLKHLGIEAVVATSFAGIFYRNSINLGLPVFVLPSSLTDVPQLKDGAQVSVDFGQSMLKLTDFDIHINLEPLPNFLRDLVADGGLVPHLTKRFAG